MMLPPTSASPQVKTERRSHVRRKMQGLTYVDLGPLNGGILLDLSQGGLCFHSVAPVSLEQAVLLKFKLPGAMGFIQSHAEVVWLNETRKRGGLRFAGLSPEVREQIGVWAGVVRATEVGAEVPQESETILLNETGTQNASANGETTRAFEPIRDTEDFAPELIVESPAEILEPFTNATSATNRLEAGGSIPVAEISDEHSSAEGNAVTAHRNYRMPALPGGDRSTENSTGHQADSMRVQQPEAAEPATRNPIARTAGNAAVKAPPVADALSERVASRVHSGIMAVSASEWSAVAQRIDPSEASGAGEATLSKQGTVCQASELTPPSNRKLNQEWAPKQEVFGPQVLKIGIGAAVGASLALALVASVPGLRMRARATTKAKSAALTLKGEIPEFQVEVADINNRRWILKSDGKTGSPFGAGTEGHATESERSRDVPELQSPRTAKRGELALARPLSGQPVGSQVQTLPPSIFDGITPPLGSLTGNSPLNELIVPGPVPVPSPAANLQAAVLLKHVSPVYPAAALRDNIRGEVRIRATIGTDGIPTNLKLLSGDPRLGDAALGAIRQWRYRPAKLEGQPIETTTTVTVVFQPN